MYQQAVADLVRAADQVAQYRADLAAFADHLDGRRWGAEVTGPIADMDTALATTESTYQDLAAQMRHQGDQGADAYDHAPWVPDNLITQETGATTDPPMPPHPDHGSAADDAADDAAEPVTHCLECEDPLDAPVRDEDQAVHAECDPAHPARYEIGQTNHTGRIKPGTGETHRRLHVLADTVIDLIATATEPVAYGELTVRLDQTHHDARAWAELPETQALAGTTLPPARQVVITTTCPTCGTPITGTTEVRGAPGQTRGVQQQITCGGCHTTRTVQGIVPLTDTSTVFHPAESVDQCLTCGNPLVMPVDTVDRAHCAICNWQVNRCYVGQIIRRRFHIGTAVGYPDVLDMALDLVHAADTSALAPADFAVQLPDQSVMDAHAWARRPHIQELASRNLPGRAQPTTFANGLTTGKLRRATS